MSESEQDNGREEPTEATTDAADETPPAAPAGGQASHPEMPQRPRKWLPLFLFLVTCVSTFLAGAFDVWIRSPEASIAFIQENGLIEFFHKGNLCNGLLYFLPVMSILLAHEMGHYLINRFYRVPASYPYFIPMPFTPWGTMGAVIFQEIEVADRKQAFDVAIAGQLAGMVLVLPCAWYGMSQTVVEIPEPLQYPVLMLRDPLILEWMKEHFHGTLSDNETIRMTPLLMAAWFGILYTALNLIPIGQLDGGRILYCLIGRRAHRISIGLLFFAVAWMFHSGNILYLLIVILLLASGPRHPPTADDTVPLGPWRIVSGWLLLAFIAIGITPNPVYVLKPEQEVPAESEVVRRDGVVRNGGLTPRARLGELRAGDHSSAGLAISSGLGLVEGNSLIRRLRNSTGDPSDSRQM